VSVELTRLRAALAGRYTVTGVLGQGGMATVYRATDVKHERDVAIKVMPPELAESIQSKRFLQEIIHGFSACMTPEKRTTSSTTSCRWSRARRCAAY
jgi:serine/threonine protein kinase